MRESATEVRNCSYICLSSSGESDSASARSKNASSLPMWSSRYMQYVLM